MTRTAKIIFRLTPDELAQVTATAAADHMMPASWVRKLVLDECDRREHPRTLVDSREPYHYQPKES